MNGTIIIGASGLVGGQLTKILTSQNQECINTHCNTPINNSIFLDISRGDDVIKLIKRVKPAYIFLPAAITNVDQCEQDATGTYNINVIGVRNVVEAANAIHAKLIYFSTDYIFDGKNGPYHENDPANPICEYGKQKLKAERIVTTQMNNYLIIRTTGVFGWEHQGKNYIARLIDALKKEQKVQAPSDQVGSPTYAPYLSETSIHLAFSDAQGIFNVAGKDLVSRYELACQAAKIFQLNANLVRAVETKELNQIAKRPLNGGLDNSKLFQHTQLAPLDLINYLTAMAKI